MSRRWGRRLRLGLGGLLLACAAFGVAYPLWWNARSSGTGKALVADAGRQATTACPRTPTLAAAPGRGPGILEIPAINVVAPVLDGVSDTVLGVAVGHVPQAPWPGASGEAMVLAHDVSYFSNLSAVRPGTEVLWVAPCLRASFSVDAAGVDAPGEKVLPPEGGSGLALVTCYPTNALFWTPQRFVVRTHLVGESVGPQLLPRIDAPVPKLSVPAPPALRQEGLTLAENPFVLGVLRLSGTPSATFAAGPAPLDVEAKALAVLFGAKRAVAAHNASWWRALAPKLAMPAAWPSFGPGASDVTITVDGASPRAITVASGSARATIVVDKHLLHLGGIS